MTTAAPRPSLGFARFGPTQSAAPLVIALGDRDHTVDRWLRPLCADFSFAALEAPRGADPRRYGVPNRSGDWYLADEHGAEPSSFGLALIALERFVLYERNRAAAPPILLGVGQGATLCLALALCWAEELNGVIAIEGEIAKLPTGAIEEAPLLGLPFLILDRSGRSDGDPDASERVRAHISDRGGRTTFVRTADAGNDGSPIAAWLKDVVRTQQTDRAQPHESMPRGERSW